MSQGTKGSVGILGALLLISIFVTLSTFNQKSALERANVNLEKQIVQSQDREGKQITKNKELADTLKSIQEKEKKARRAADELKARIQKLNNESDQWQSKIDELRSERDKLIAQLQETQQQLESEKKIKISRRIAADVRSPRY